jgi:hypothetical protein
MADPNEIVYCLACSRPMMAVDALCPSCGTAQAAARVAAREHTFVQGTEGCARCARPLAPGAAFCSCCGASTVVPSGAAKQVYAVYIAVGAVLSGIALLGNCPPVFGLLAAVLGYRAQRRNPQHWAAPFLVGAALAATAFGSLVFLVRAFNEMSQGLL